MAEEEYPSAPKREVDLGRGVVILPPERLVSPKKPEKPKEEKKEEITHKQVIQKPTEKQVSNLLFLVVALIAIISLVTSIISMLSIASLKSQLKAITADLKEFSKSTIELNTEFNQPHSLQSSAPLSKVISPFSIPVPAQEIEGKGTITAIIPGYNYPISIPWEGRITVFGSISANTSAIPDSEKLNINYTIPSSGTVKMRVQVSDLFQGKLASAIEKLEKLSRD